MASRQGLVPRAHAPSVPRAVTSGVETMTAFAREFPAGLLDGFESGRRLAATANDAVDGPLFAVGLGGSAIAAELVGALLEAETPSSLRRMRGSELPGGVREDTAVVLVSYSGETQEVLEAYGAAGRRHARRVVVTSGGRLRQRALADGVPVLPLPRDRPPRAALGPMFGGLLGLLDDRFPHSNARRLRLASRGALLQLERPRSPTPTAVAQTLLGRQPVIVGSAALAAVARRWENQLEENAKTLAAVQELPEALHNALVGWEAMTPSEARARVAVLLSWRGDPVRVGAAGNYLARRLRARGVHVANVVLRPADRLAAITLGVLLGDLVSLELARLRGVDPFRVDAVAKARAAVGRATHRG